MRDLMNLLDRLKAEVLRLEAVRDQIRAEREQLETAVAKAQELAA